MGHYEKHEEINATGHSSYENAVLGPDAYRKTKQPEAQIRAAMAVPDIPLIKEEEIEINNREWEEFVRSTCEVNSPTHYTSHPSGVECIDITEHLNFCLGNAIKYIWRAGLKKSTTKETDLTKAIWYLQRELSRTGGKLK